MPDRTVLRAKAIVHLSEPEARVDDLTGTMYARGFVTAEGWVRIDEPEMRHDGAWEPWGEAPFIFVPAWRVKVVEADGAS